jgi:hypothetical protein
MIDLIERKSEPTRRPGKDTLQKIKMLRSQTSSRPPSHYPLFPT